MTIRRVAARPLSRTLARYRRDLMSQPIRAAAALAALTLLLAACDDGELSPREDGGTGEVDTGDPVLDAGPDGDVCAPLPFGCDIAETLTGIPIEVVARTDLGAVDAHGGSMCGVGRGGGEGGTGALDMAYQFTAPAAGRYEITTDGSTFDTLLSVRTDCSGEELICNDDIGGGSRTSAVELMLDACQTILIVVDGYNADESGSFRLNITAPEQACDDEVDNDGDGLMDCEDPDCFSLECDGGDGWPVEWQALEWEVLELTNQARARGHDCDTRGVFGPAPPLEMNELIRTAARAHALDMGEQDYFEHTGLDGRSFSDRMREAGFMGAFPWGENIATGQRTAREVVNGWLESDGHCANIMGSEYRTIGVGYAFVESSMYGEQWAQDFAASH